MIPCNELDQLVKEVFMKKVLILGAYSAIAEAVAQQLAEQGHTFYLLGRRLEKLETLKQDLLIRGAQAVHMQTLDINDLTQHTEILTEVLDKLGQIDIALIAQGILPKQKQCEQDVALTLHTINTNAANTIAFLTLLANQFEKQQQGSIAVITSVAGDRGRKTNYVYGASKAMLSTFLQGLRNRLFQSKVQVLEIKPGSINTPMTAHMPKNILFAEPKQVATDIIKAIHGQKDILYTPVFWRWIMFIIKHIPEKIFKRLSL